MAAHLVAVDAEDIAILARKGVHVVHNPGSNLILGSGEMCIRDSDNDGLGVEHIHQ